MSAAPDRDCLLDVRGLSVAFGDKTVVHGVDFSIAPGEKLALVGESGSGKTVTALALLQLAQNARLAGSAVLAGTGGQGEGAGARDLLSVSERGMLGIRGSDIAMIFQEPMTALNPLFTVGDQVAEVLQLQRGMTRREAWEAAVQALAATGIPDPARRAHAYPHQLSGGQRQRAMIAIALACRPRLLLADEPTTALDVTLRGQVLDLLSDLQRETGMAVMVITHDLNLVRKFADRVAVMENGHLVEQGTVAEVFSAPRHPYTRKLIESRPVRDVVDTEPAVETAPILQAQALRVTYPVPLAGFKGWFRRGEYVAVQGGGGFVRQQEARAAGQGHGDHRALALAARELVGKGLGPARRVGNAGGGQRLDGRVPGLAATHAAFELQHLGHLVAHGVQRVQRRHGLLKDHGDVAATDSQHLALGHGQQVAVPCPGAC